MLAQKEILPMKPSLIVSRIRKFVSKPPNNLEHRANRPM